MLKFAYWQTNHMSFQVIAYYAPVRCGFNSPTWSKNRSTVGVRPRCMERGCHWLPLTDDILFCAFARQMTSQIVFRTLYSTFNLFKPSFPPEATLKLPWFIWSFLDIPCMPPQRAHLHFTAPLFVSSGSTFSAFRSVGGSGPTGRPRNSGWLRLKITFLFSVVLKLHPSNGLGCTFVSSPGARVAGQARRTVQHATPVGNLGNEKCEVWRHDASEFPEIPEIGLGMT